MRRFTVRNSRVTLAVISLIGIIPLGIGCGGGGDGSGGGEGGGGSNVSSPIRLNEVLFFAPTGTEWVELYNPDSDPADIDLFEINNKKGDAYSIPEALPKVPPHGYVVILFDGVGSNQDDYDFNDGYAVLHTDALSGDVFNDTSDTCTLYSGRARSESSRVDFVAWGDYAHHGHYVNNALEYDSYGPVTANQSIGIHPDAYTIPIPTNWVMYAEDETTQGTENVIPAPVPVVPIENSTNRVNTVSFAWRDWHINVREFHLEVDDSNDFSSPEISVSTASSLYHSEVSLADGTYYWRVKTITENSEESSWSRTHAFEIESEENIRPLLLSSKDLGLWPPVIQRKDTNLLCLECDETGEHSWNKEHVGTIESIHKCPHCSTYCSRASIAMLNRYYHGSLKQDEISYHMFRDVVGDKNPAGDLGHGKGLSGELVSQALGWALGTGPVEQEPFSFATIKKYIDEGRPLLGATPTHVLVIDGYDDYEGTSEDTMHVIDPWIGMEEPVKLTETTQVALWAPPKDSQGISGDPDVLTDYDKDGIMDFDEYSRFQSYTFFEDSDFDGILDFKEVWGYRFGKGVKPRYPDKGLWIWLNPNYDGDLYTDGNEDLNKNGTMDPGECDPFVAEAPLIVSLEVAGADGGEPKVWINTKVLGNIEYTGSKAGYYAREIKFLACGFLDPGAANFLTIQALQSGTNDLYDDIQIRNIKIVDQNNNTVLLNQDGPYHLGDNTLKSIWEEYENGHWQDPNLPGFWTELYGPNVMLTFSVNE